MNKKTWAVLAVLFFAFTLLTDNLNALSVGQSVHSLKIKNADDITAWIPHIGKKTVVLFYMDPDAPDVSDPILDELKKTNLQDKFHTIVIFSLKDTWKPNAAVRYAARQKKAKYKSSIILLDTDHTVKKRWGLGDCDNKNVVIVIGKDKKVRFVQKVSSQIQAHGIKSQVLNKVKENIK